MKQPCFFPPVVYKFTKLLGCSDSVDEAIFSYDLDQNEIVFVDFKAKQQFGRLPPFADPIDFQQLFVTMYDHAVASKTECIQGMKNLIAAADSPPEPKGNETQSVLVV